MVDHRRSRKPAVLPVVVATVALVAALLAPPAGAHVTVEPGSAPRGGFAVLSFSVPDEQANASTVGLQVMFPSDTPLAFVSVRPLPGWTYTVDRAKLPKPVQTDDGTVTDAVSVITWKATGPGIRPGEFELFTVSVGPLPKAKQLVFKALQTYSTGEVVRWIETPVKGSPEPEHPAPTLTLTRPRKG